MKNGHSTAEFTIHKMHGDGPIRNGDPVYLRSPSHDNDFVECDGSAGAGYGVSTRDNMDVMKNGYSTAEFTIYIQPKAVASGDTVYLRNPSHDSHFVECDGRAGAGYGVSTRDNKDEMKNGHSTAEFTIHKIQGEGAIANGDAVYLRNPSHDNDFVECDGRAGAGYGVSTRDNKDEMKNGHSTAEFTIHKFYGGEGPIANGDA